MLIGFLPRMLRQRILTRLDRSFGLRFRAVCYHSPTAAKSLAAQPAGGKKTGMLNRHSGGEAMESVRIVLVPDYSGQLLAAPKQYRRRSPNIVRITNGLVLVVARWQFSLNTARRSKKRNGPHTKPPVGRSPSSSRNRVIVHYESHPSLLMGKCAQPPARS